MNKVIIVSKTHLDLGFTDLANNVLNRYINEFIPNSIAIAEEVNIDGKKFGVNHFFRGIDVTTL